jgi:glycosyltransferase involved in cell wall biosynthesis
MIVAQASRVDVGMHVLVLPSWYPSDHAPASGTFFRDQAIALSRAGHRVGVIAPDLRSMRTLAKGRLAFGRTSGPEGPVHVHRLTSVAIPKFDRLNGKRWRDAARDLFRTYTAEHGNPDIVHAHSAIWAGVAAARIFRESRTPFVLTEHSTAFARRLFEDWHQAFLSEAFLEAGAVVAVSNDLRDRVRTFRPGGNIDVIPNCVDVETFTLPPEGRKSRRFDFTCIAFLDPKKAIDVLLQAFERAFGARDDVCLHIVGDGPESPRLQELARRLGIDGNVRFHGLRDRLGVRDILWQSHCCVSSSQVETFGVTLIEALATGIPVVATRSGGPDDIVTPECGYLTPVGDVSALADAMLAVHQTRSTWAERAPQLRSGAERRYGPAAVAGRLEAVFNVALGGPS